MIWNPETGCVWDVTHGWNSVMLPPERDEDRSPVDYDDTEDYDRETMLEERSS